MKTKLDLKSALLGVGLGIVITLGVAATTAPGLVGRYQVGGTGNHGLVIDTVTGQVWSAYLPAHEGKTDAGFYTPKSGDKK